MAKDPTFERIIALSLEVKVLRDQLALKETELANLSNATTTRKATVPAPPPARSKPVKADEEPPAPRDKIRAIMADGKRHTTEEVAKALGIKQGRVGDAMKRMADLERIKGADGTYVARPTKSGARKKRR